MTNKLKLLALIVPLVLVGCSGRSGAEDAVRAALKDPDSAKFGDFYYNKKTGKACLSTNAKNAMGGYTGESQVHLSKTDGEWVYESDAEETHDYCRSKYADAADSTEVTTAADLEKMAEELESAVENATEQ